MAEGGSNFVPNGSRDVSGSSTSSRPVSRELPCDERAEAGLLAACMLEGSQETLTLCMESRLRNEAFSVLSHQVIFQVMVDLATNGKAIDDLLVLNQLRSRTVDSIPWLHDRAKRLRQNTEATLLDIVGGVSTVNEINSQIEGTAHAPYWLEIVREKWMLRRLIQSSQSIVERAYTQQDKLSHFIDSVEKEILAINEDRVSESTQEFKVGVDNAMSLVARIMQGDTDEGVPTGYVDIDKMTFGMHPGQMIVLAARPSMGKTSLAMNIAEHVTRPLKGDGLPTLVFSLEMPSDQLAMRMICGRSRVNMGRVRDRMIGKQQMHELTQAAKELKQAPLYIDDSSNLNILELRAKARRLHRKRPLSFIMIDYLQLISGIDNRVAREQQIAEISRGIKGLAKELNIPILVLSQLNRESEKEKRLPRISDLRESGSIEQDADVVFLLATNPKAEDNPNVPQASRERLLVIAKQRNGPTGEVPLTFIPEFTRFENFSRTPSDV
jgi:replicative DNA helicase|tara:strand:- start:149853 stop:151340 length:1488 start_codon:yes stop_codon:yes gene_type:complete